MASQPLETIPEEPTAALTPPPNSPTPARVTADPPTTTKPAKNPGRVESGKRLAERNRLAREAKKQEQAASASNTTTATASASNTTTATATASDNNNNNNLSLVIVLGIGGLIVSALGVYYQREAIMARFKPAPPAQPAPAPTPAPSRIPVKRGIKEME